MHAVIMTTIANVLFTYHFGSPCHLLDLVDDNSLSSYIIDAVSGLCVQSLHIYIDDEKLEFQIPQPVTIRYHKGYLRTYLALIMVSLVL